MNISHQSDHNKEIDKERPIIFFISGGAGKNIMATAVVHELKKLYPKSHITIATAWPAIWQHNPDITTITDPTKSISFYKDQVQHSHARIFRLDPYNTSAYINHEKHLIEIWCDLYKIPYRGARPSLHFTEEEFNDVKVKLFTNKNTTSPQKPLFFIQSSGGASNQPYPISWARDLPLHIAQEVVDMMNIRGYRTIHLRRDNQPSLRGSDFIPFSLRQALCALHFSDKRLFVDSVAQHASKCLELPSVVTWITNSPVVFGYSLHTNIVPKEKTVFRHHIDSYLEEYNISGLWHEHPYMTDALFSAEDIVHELTKK